MTTDKPRTLCLDLDMSCMRCGYEGMLIVGYSNKAWEDRALCLDACRGRPWSCPKCEGARVPEHTRWCTTEHPEVASAQAGLVASHLRLVLRLLAQLDPDLIDEDPADDEGAEDDRRAAFDEDPSDDDGALDDEREARPA